MFVFLVGWMNLYYLIYSVNSFAQVISGDFAQLELGSRDDAKCCGLVEKVLEHRNFLEQDDFQFVKETNNR